VLAWVPGHPLTGHNPAERRLIGTTLARVHRALAGGDTAAAQRLHWVDPDAGYLSLRPWLRPAIAAALAALDAADPAAMSWGLLHADPAPEAFRLDPATGRCGVIDWSYFLHGPLPYDLASAIMYVGGPAHAGDLIEAYLKQGPLIRREVHQGLAAMLRFRWAVQANYFAWRIANNDLTGISSPGENEKGLEDARRSLTFLSVVTCIAFSVVQISSSPGMIASRVFALVRLAREVVRRGGSKAGSHDRIHARSLPVSLQPLRLRSQGPSAAA
jgi:Ser/Thr protein kinase RdoA (MazF antagonist)